MKTEFPGTVSYNRFVELQNKIVIPLGAFVKITYLDICTSISFIDFTPLRVYHTRREKQYKVFKGIAQKG